MKSDVFSLKTYINKLDLLEKEGIIQWNLQKEKLRYKKTENFFKMKNVKIAKGALAFKVV